MLNRIQRIEARHTDCTDANRLWNTAAYLDCLADHVDCDEDTRRDAIALSSKLCDRAFALEAL